MGYAAPRRIIGVEEGHAIPREQPHQPQLGGAIRLHRAMIVEVITREIRKDRRREREAIHPTLIE